ncbi:MAG: hypothetical protein ACRBG0_06300 [Lewinella sp.]|jgi:hypothetical protein|uniref:hypothetical protein n=1 Tax=Lewinella sp. TaxID=2004506 RepID=UPI003D6AC8C7
MSKYLSYAMTIFTMVLILSSCNQADEAQAAVDQKDTFFSLEKFFEAEEERLQSANIGLDKEIRINEKEEQQLIADIDYSREFSMFRKADINRPAWSDKYQADSTLQQGALEIRYTSLDPELKTQELFVMMNKEGEVEKIEIISQTETALAGNKSWMTYEPALGYHIKTQQKNRTAETLNIEIKGGFVSQ